VLFLVLEVRTRVWIQRIVKFFLEILNLMVSYNEQIAEVIAKTPKKKNASYTSSMIQKEILHIFSTKVNEAIRKKNW